MKHLTRLAALLAFCPALAAGPWAPLPASIWAIKEDPARGIKDAVVLENRMNFMGWHVDYLLRVRVLTNAGRKAVEMPPFSADSYDFEGRTITPDGKIVTFSQRQDFQERSEEVGEASQSRKVVIPPGVTDNCVVELKWRESSHTDAISPLPKRLGRSASWQFGSPWFTFEQSISVPRNFIFAHTCAPSRTFRPELTEVGNTRQYLVRNLPAFPEEPHSLSVSHDRPVFWVYDLPPMLGPFARTDITSFWEVVGRRIFGEWFGTQLETGSAYRTYKYELQKKRPSKGTQDVALAALAAIRRDFLNLDQMTEAERAARPKSLVKPQMTDLNEMVKQRAGTAMGLRFLLFRLLKDTGCAPRPLLVEDRNRAVIQWHIPNLWQFGSILSAVAEPGKATLYLDAGDRMGDPHLLNVDYQETRALLLDPSDRFKPEAMVLPAQPASLSLARYDYTVSAADAEDRFEFTARFTGQADRIERFRYYEKDSAGRNKDLKKRFEDRLKGAVISKAEMTDPLDPATPMRETVAGTLEATPGRRRTVSPFPGMPSAVYLPDSLPATRTLPIVTSYLRQVEGQSTLAIPTGYRLVEQAAMQQSNAFGSVSWELLGNGTQAKVTLKVETCCMVSAPDTYPEFKAFLGWVDAAQRRVIQFEKE